MSNIFWNTIKYDSVGLSKKKKKKGMISWNWKNGLDAYLWQSYIWIWEEYLRNTHSMELRDIGVHVMPEEGTTSSPRKIYPPWRLKQWPPTFRVRPRWLSCVKILALPLPRPRTPAVEGGACAPVYFRSYPHLEISVKKNHDTSKFGIEGKTATKSEDFISSSDTNKTKL